MNAQTALIVSLELNALYFLATLGAFIPGRVGEVCNVIGMAMRTIFGLDKGQPIVLQLHPGDTQALLDRQMGISDAQPAMKYPGLHELAPNVTLSQTGELRIESHRGMR